MHHFMDESDSDQNWKNETQVLKQQVVIGLNRRYMPFL